MKNFETTLDLVTPADLVNAAEDAAFWLKKKGIKTHQLRKIYGYVGKLRTAFKRNNQQYEAVAPELVFLKPMVAFTAGKQPQMKPFYHFMKSAIEGVEHAEQADLATKRFLVLMESIVAYHRFYVPK